MTYLRRKRKDHRRRLTAGWSPATAADVFVCDVSDELKANLDVVTSASQFRLYSQGSHIYKQPGPEEALLLINSLKHVIEHAEYIAIRKRGRVFAVVGPTEDGKDVLVAIKFVPAEFASSKVDEAWIRTSRFIGEKEKKRDRFQPIS